MKRVGAKGMTPYQIKHSVDLQKVRDLHLEATKHPDYEACDFYVNSKLDHSHYEMGTVLMISKDRYVFDQYYDLDYVYRGGFIETKLGENYILYGFTFD